MLSGLPVSGSAEAFLNSIAGLWSEKKANAGSGNGSLQRKGRILNMYFNPEFTFLI
jgi:hypothetical protein